MMLYALLLAPRYAVLRPQGTPAESKALIKITLSTRLVVFFTQCYSVVKNHPPSKASHLGGLNRAISLPSSALSKNQELPIERCLVCPKFGAKRPALLNRYRNLRWSLLMPNFRQWLVVGG
jgi:hypothetical protein